MGLVAVIDLETTGVNPWRHDRIIEVGAVVLDQDGTCIREFTTLVNPERDVGASNVHGLQAGDLLQAPRFQEVAAEFTEFLTGVGTVVGHNVHFDRSFVEREFERLEHRLPSIPALCTLRLAGGGKLLDCCRDFGVAPPTVAHSALDDAHATARLFTAILEDTPTIYAQAFETPEIFWPKVTQKRGRLVNRSVARAARSRTPTYVQQLVARASEFPAEDVDDGVAIAYTATLDRLLEDRLLTPAENEELFDLALHWGLNAANVERLNRSYIRHLVAIALADGTVTPIEQRDLQQVTTLLGVEETHLNDILQSGHAHLTRGNKSSGLPSTGSSLTGLNDADATKLRGLSVCFTGTLRGLLRGEPITREVAEELARTGGLIPVDSVTQKTDLLVVADPETQSGKAKKARKYGVRILPEATLWRILGVPSS